MEENSNHKNITHETETNDNYDSLVNISHEIRTPLNAIICYAHLLHQEAQTAIQLDHSSKLLQTANHLQALINNYLDLAKLEAGGTKLEKRSFNPAKVVERVCSMLAGLAAAKSLELSLNIKELPLMVRGDETRLSQILINIISNAIKFTSVGKVAVNCRVLSRSADNVLLRFEIVDSGIGLTPEQISCLFADYKQAAESTTRIFGGTGLGLVISKGLVDLMAGSIGAQSVVNQGSTFWLEIPFLHSSQPQTPAEDTLNQKNLPNSTVLGKLLLHRGDTRILVVEDNASNREVISHLLNYRGLQVQTAASGRTAVEMVSKSIFNLILMDIRLPLMDGWQTARAIRSFSNYAQVPIIALTACACTQNLKSTLVDCMNDYIAKPIDPDALYNILIKWLNKDCSHNKSNQASGLCCKNQAKQSDQRCCQAQAYQPKTAVITTKKLSNQGFLAVAKSVAGLDAEAGLYCLHYNLPLYQELLNSFRERHKTDGEKMQNALLNHELKIILRLAHTLKGVGGSLGVVRVQSLATRIHDLTNQIADFEQKNNLSNSDNNRYQFILADSTPLNERLLANAIAEKTRFLQESITELTTHLHQLCDNLQQFLHNKSD
ncbi:MAG: response regulator [Ruminococcaceae bacterium]|nr:response regulator [Oscillospiraceae bacterium]